jgi:hypothetical protein
MPENVKERYSTYPRKKEKKPVRPKEGEFLKRSFEWLKWKVIQIGDYSFHKPCLEP